MKNFSIKRFTASLLFIVMVVAALPVSLFNFTISTSAADGEITYVLAGSDFQASSHAAGATIVSGLLDKIKVDYPTMNGFLFAGDYDVNYNDSANGKAKLQETVQAVYGTGMDEIYVQGNHDGDGLVGSTLTASGANDAENYGVFVINEKDYMWYNDDEATIKKTAENLETYLNAKRNADYTKPIFVISHLPLHYSMRTRSGGKDGMHANYIFDVLNEAGNAGLNIIFMFGHDHSHGWDDYLGGAAIYLAKGDKINIAQNSTTVFEEETLAFTYMNAGYVGYYGTSYTSDVDKTLTMSVFEITGDTVTVKRYDSEGLHYLKSTGVYNVEYPDSAYYSTNSAVYSSPQTITLNKTITPAGEEVEAPDSGNTGSGATQRTYTRVTSTSELVSGGQYLIIHNGQNDFMIPVITSNDTRIGYDLVAGPSGLGNDNIYGDYQEYEWTFTSVSGGWNIGSDAGYIYFEAAGSRHAARLGTTAHTMVIGGSANEFTFTNKTYSNGNYVLNYNETGDLINGYASGAAPFYIYRMTNEGSSGGSIDTECGDWVTITKPTTAGTKYVYELDTNGIDTGVEYLIVANSYPKALSAAASSNNAVDIEIDGNYAYATSDTYGWTFTQRYSGYDSGVYYIRLNNSTYLALSDNALGSSNSTGSSRRWTVTSNNDGSYDIVSNNYNLRWSNSNGVFQASSSNEGPVRLYKYVKTESTPAQAGLYGKIEGELIYNVANGTSPEDAVAAVQNGIAVMYATAADYSDAKTLTDEEEKSLITWTLDPSYNGEVGGEYAVTIAYNGVTLGVAKVVVPTVNITGYSVEPAIGTVNKGASQATQTGSLIYVQLENGKYYTVPVTVAMLTKADGSAVSTGESGTFENLTLTYNGVTITKNYTLNVTTKSANDYPEYPNEGAVKVSKTAIYTDKDFRKTGVAQVELSVSGVPSKKGADVIVMLDLSSSMTNTVDGKTRISVLEASLQSMMSQLQAKGDDGQPMDIRIAVADFNRYYLDSDSPYYINSADTVAGGSIRTNNSGTNKVYTGSYSLDADAFVDVHTLADNEFSGLSTQSGTNYDYAFDAVYQLGEAITAKNATEGVERDLFVIFMSDGAPFQFNYFSSQSDGTGAAEWNNWLTGTLDTSDIDNGANASYYNEDGKHWMAEAIKGDPSSTYPVIRKNNAADTDGDTWVNVNGLGAKMYSIGFCLAVDKDITVDTMDTVIRNLASNDQYYYRADNAAALGKAFTQIGHDIAYAANNARFVDQMGDAFDIQLTNYVERWVTGADGQPEKITLDDINPTITVKTYDIWTRQDYLTGQCTIDQIGVRKGTSTVLETVSFTDDGNGTVTGAYSDQINNKGTNILADGTQTGYYKNVIYAKTFVYNNNKDGTYAYLDTDGDGVEDYALAPETFYWKVGTVQSQELAISYYVYLTDTMEGERQSGSYATNNFAILYYDNYLGNECEIHTVSPMLAWKEANVSYAFYLVDQNGTVIVNRATGETGTFANKVAVTRPVVFDTCKLNTETKLAAIEIANTEGILPEGYKIFDEAASYSVIVLSDQEDKEIGWEINKASVATTYVTGYSTTDAYSNVQSMHETTYDYTHTTVWFAVVWTPSTIPDQVVIDYGLPVDISVLENDLFGAGAKLNGVADSDKKPVSANNGYVSNHVADFLSTRTSAFGTAAINDTKVRYAPLNMQMNTYDSFAYEVQYVINNETQYYYGDVTVIPATTIYYEESFVKFNDAEPNDGTYGVWVNEGTAVAGVQEEDRPGKDSLGTIDHDNVYGYDAINNSSTKYSLGTAKKVSVNSTYGYHKDYSPTATFTFTGTGFDIISMTNSDSGVIFITATNTKTGNSTNKFVDNYYGYTYDETNGWTPAPDPTAAIYQVPVMKISDLDYGTYDVTIWVTYGEYFDHDGTEGYSFWLDSIRIYDPAVPVYDDPTTEEDESDVIGGAYIADNESNPHYLQIKDAILAASDVNNDKLSGIVFIDGKTSTTSVADYNNPGPNNEAYLAKGQSISFKLQSNATPLDVQIGVKLAYGDSADVQFTYTVGSKSESKVRTFTTATDMYYSIASYMGLVHDNQQNDNAVAWTSGTITLTNTSDSVISLTNVKATFKLANYPVSGSMSTTSTATYSASVFSLMSSHNRTLTTSNLEATEETMPVSISFLVDAEVIEAACAVMTALYAPEPEIFVPAALEYTVTNRFFGNSTVNVITSKDVASLTVNGVEAKKLSNSPLFSMLLKLIGGFEGRFGTNISANDYIVWSASVKRAANYDIVAYNADGLSSDPTVTDSSSSITKEDIDNYFNRSELYSIMEQMASQRFDPEQFEAYVNERFDGFREIITQTSEDVEYVIINGKIVDRYITETVIDTETGETTTKRVWITDAEDDVEDEDVEVNAYDEKGVGSESKWAERKFGWKKNSNNSNNNSNNGNSNSASDKNNSNKENNGKGNSGKYGRM